MKRIFATLCAIVLSVFACTLTACGGPATNGEELLQFSGITLEDATFVYDGKPHAISVSGAVPSEAAVRYENNEQTDAGSYPVRAIVTASGYETLELSATLTIQRAQFPQGVDLAGGRFLYDGNPHSLEVSGPLPDGTKIEYKNNGQTEPGFYDVTATLTNPNYETSTLSATLEIYTIAQAADQILSDVLDRPEPWSFLPAAFAPEAMAYENMPVSGNDFSVNTPIASIRTRPIGRQLNVLYEGLSTADHALTVANMIFTAGEAITSVYQNFIDRNPGDYDTFTGTITLGGAQLRLHISLEGETVTLLAGNDTVSIELLSDRSPDAVFRNEGRIQITDGITLKYQMSETALKLAVRFTINGVGATQWIDFVRDGGCTYGTFYEFVGADSAMIKTSALLRSDAETTFVLSDKRESNDMPINAYLELYDSQTGELLGGEVTESISAINYDTFWFNLPDIGGLTAVQVTDEKNDENTLNKNSVYVNGSNMTFVPEFNTIPIIGTRTSRHYDIEMKTVWYYIAVTQSGETRYDKCEATIPMLFVQRENADDFSLEVSENNPSLSILALPGSVRSDLTAIFDDYSAQYEEIKAQMSITEVEDFIGENNSFFAQE